MIDRLRVACRAHLLEFVIREHAHRLPLFEPMHDTKLPLRASQPRWQQDGRRTKSLQGWHKLQKARLLLCTPKSGAPSAREGAEGRRGRATADPYVA